MICPVGYERMLGLLIVMVPRDSIGGQKGRFEPCTVLVSAFSQRRHQVRGIGAVMGRPGLAAVKQTMAPVHGDSCNVKIQLIRDRQHAISICLGSDVRDVPSIATTN